MNIIPKLIKPDSTEIDAYIINIFEGSLDANFIQKFPKSIVKKVQTLLDAKEFKGEKNEIFQLFPLDEVPYRLVLVGSGKREGFDKTTARENIGSAFRYLMRKEVKSIAIHLNAAVENVHFIQNLVEGILLSSFDHEIHKSKKKDIKIEEVFINFDDTKEVRDFIKTGQIIGESINWARNLEFQPSNHVTPSILVAEFEKIAKENNFEIEIFDEKQAKKMGMGGFCAIAQGSDEPSYMVVMKYQGGGKKTPTVGLVGKGITFDSGGISIKPSRSMSEMKMDMCGAANVMAMMKIIGHLRPSINVIAATPLTENLPSGKAAKPGDVVTALNGKTIEIVNTDAEGRVVLSDALVYVQRHGATKILEFSTLTGAVLIALGSITTGLMTNNDEFTGNILQAAKEEGEHMWQLPTDSRYKDLVKSHIADVTNAGEGPSKVKGAGTIAGAMFLQEFIEKDVHFAHFDIAGTAWAGGSSFMAHGPTGVGIQTAISLVTKLAGKA